jgi:hypothetical protein
MKLSEEKPNRTLGPLVFADTEIYLHPVDSLDYFGLNFFLQIKVA